MPDIVLAVTTDLTHDQRMQRTARALHQAGYRVLLVGRRLPHSRELLAEPFSQYRLKQPFKKGKAFYLYYNLQLFFLLLRIRAKALVAVDFDTLPGTYAAGIVKQVPCALDAHEFFTEVPELQGRPLSRKTWHMLGRLVIPRLSAAYTVNRSLARLMGTCYGKTFQVVRNLPEAKPLPQPKETPEPFLLYQGALNEGRGLETLIHVAGQLPLSVYLAGDGDLKPSLEAQVRQQGLEHQVHFLGKLNPEELRTVTAQAFLGFNLLAANSRNYYYSLANKFFDYMQAGVPSLSNPFPEYVRINAEYPVAKLIPLEPKPLVKTIRALWADPATYEKMRQACLAARQVYTWEQEIPALLPIYQDILPRENLPHKRVKSL